MFCTAACELAILMSYLRILLHCDAMPSRTQSGDPACAHRCTGGGGGGGGGGPDKYFRPPGVDACTHWYRGSY